MSYCVLVVDDDDLCLSATRLLLEGKGYNVDTASTGQHALEILAASPERHALVILDYHIDGEDSLKIAERILKRSPQAYILFYSGDVSREAVKSSWQAGAVGFVDKGPNLQPFLDEVARWCQKYEQTRRILTASVPSDSDEMLGLIGRSTALKEIVRKILLYRDSAQNVLLMGETGTGKELIARRLHSTSAASFLAVNCASYQGNSELLESELFGHEQGAFTGANRQKHGILELAAGGTVLLDEVHHLSLAAQAKLLRVIQEKKIRRVGGSREIGVDFRLVAAAKPALEKLTEESKFLPDLFHRLNVLSIHVPPLRERIEDIEPLVAHFCAQFQENTKQKKHFRMRTVRYLEGYSWPGNIRELENTVYRLLTECPSDKVEPEQLDAKFFSAEGNNHALPSSYLALKEKHDAEERDLLLKTLQASRSKAEAAERLRLSPSTLHSILKRLGYPRGSSTNSANS